MGSCDSWGGEEVEFADGCDFGMGGADCGECWVMVAVNRPRSFSLQFDPFR